MAKKAAEENKMRQAVASDPAKKAEFGDPWPEIAKAMDIEKQIYLPLTYLERRGGFRGDLAGIARILVRAADERAKPNGERLREYRDSALPSLEQDLFSTAPIYKSLDKADCSPIRSAEMQEKMPDSPLVKRVLNGKSPADVAAYLIDNTKLDDVAVRKQLYEGGQAAIDASTDPLIVLMREIDPEARAVRKHYDDEVDAVVARDGGDHRQHSLRHRRHRDLSRRHLHPAAELRRRPRLHRKRRRHHAEGHQAALLHHHRRRVRTRRPARQQGPLQACPKAG